MRTSTIILLCVAVVFALALAYGFIKAIRYGVAKYETHECLMWQAQSEQYQSEEYPPWYATNWQIEQCEHYGIEL